MTDPFGSWGPHLIALVQQYPARALSCVTFAIIALHWAFSSNGYWGWPGDGGDIECGGDGGD